MRVVANSLPKSGTHVITRILDLLGLKEDSYHFSGAMVRLNVRAPLHSLSKIPRLNIFTGKSSAIAVDLDTNKKNLRTNWFIHEISRVAEDHYVQGHLPYSEELCDILLNSKFKVIHIVRDPRDVLVSFVNHICRDASYPYHRFLNSLSSMEERLIVTINGLNEIFQPVNFKSRLINTAGWLKDKRVCTVKFEEIIGEAGGGNSSAQQQSVKKILAHLEHNANDASLVQHLCSGLFDKNSPTFNKGKKGAWEKHFTPKVENEYNSKLGNHAKSLGY